MMLKLLFYKLRYKLTGKAPSKGNMSEEERIEQLRRIVG